MRYAELGWEAASITHEVGVLFAVVDAIRVGRVLLNWVITSSNLCGCHTVSPRFDTLFPVHWFLFLLDIFNKKIDEALSNLLNIGAEWNIWKCIPRPSQIP